MARPSKPLKPRRAPKPSVALLPKEVAIRYRIADYTRSRWEREGKLPKRDFFIGGKPRGWKLETLLRAEAGEVETA